MDNSVRVSCCNIKPQGRQEQMIGSLSLFPLLCAPLYEVIREAPRRVTKKRGRKRYKRLLWCANTSAAAEQNFVLSIIWKYIGHVWAVRNNWWLSDQITSASDYHIRPSYCSVGLKIRWVTSNHCCILSSQTASRWTNKGLAWLKSLMDTRSLQWLPVAF